jgi:peroxiredoxin
MEEKVPNPSVHVIPSRGARRAMNPVASGAIFGKVATAGLILILICVALSSPPAGAQIGTKFAGFRLTDTDGKTRALEDYAGNIVVLVFWSFKCPVAAAEHMVELESKYRGGRVSVLAVASNRDESPVEIRRNAENLNLGVPVLLDQDGTLAQKLGVTQTPSVVILDVLGTLRYRGAIDNNKRPGEHGRTTYAEDALDALLAGQAVPKAETKMSGCSIR